MISTLFLIVSGLLRKFHQSLHLGGLREVTLHHWNTAFRLAYDLTLPEGAWGVNEFLHAEIGMRFAGEESVGGLAGDGAGGGSANHFNLAGNTRSGRRTSRITFPGQTGVVPFALNKNPRRTEVVCRSLNSD